MELIMSRNKNIFIGLLLLLPIYTQAGQVSVPNAFVSGTAAKSAEVNENFNSLQTAVNDNDNRITINSDNIENNSLSINDNATGISDNIADISSNSSAIASFRTPLLVKYDGVSIGSPVAEAGGLFILNDNSYLFAITKNLSAPREIRTITVRFESSDCSGQPFVDARNERIGGVLDNGVVFVIVSPTLSDLYYLSPEILSAGPTSVTYNSSSYSNVCLSGTSTSDMFIPSINNPDITGVSLRYYPLPLTLGY